MILYQKDNNDQIRIWTISVEGFTIIIEHGVLNGKMQVVHEPIVAGKANRSIGEQIESRVNSRINKQLAKGYRNSIQAATEFAHANELNLFKPMLAQQFDKQKSVNTSGAVLQRKLDGNRMLVTRQAGQVLAYTRGGKLIKTLDHIIGQMHWLTEGQTVDGEVYKHGMALKDIRGGIAKKQASTLELDYHIYDVIDDMPFKERFKQITSYTQEESEARPNIVVEPYWAVITTKATNELFGTVRQQGYEGLMMRLNDFGYEAGKRSKSLLKIKYRHDAEYEVIDVEVGKNGAGILVMRLPNGRTVKGVAPGTFEQKIHVSAHPEAYIGRLCTCSFAYLTDFGIPFHLTCDRWLA